MTGNNLLNTIRTAKINWLIFTDLDGTLLDVDTYSFDPAIESLRYLKNRDIPVIPCTSKTHIEVLEICKKCGLSGPLIVENGSAVFFRKEYFKVKTGGVSYDNEYDVLVLGQTYDLIIKFFGRIKRKFDLSLKGFHEMAPEEIAHYTGLSVSDSELAKTRLYSEPFVFLKNPGNLDLLQNFVEKNGFRLLRGNRFYHLIGNTDKGIAVKKLISLYRLSSGDTTFSTIGIGDSMNDRELLLATDYAVLVKKKTGLHQSGIHHKNLLLTNNIGPAGWNEAITKIIKLSPHD
ncbi:MAG: HAD-IIB family hydrolase [Calditrichaceae bacterium]